MVPGGSRTGATVGGRLETGRTRARANSAGRASSTRRLHRNFLALRPGRLRSRASRSEADVWPRRATAALPQAPPAVTALIEAAANLQAVCEAMGWRYCFIGG